MVLFSFANNCFAENINECLYDLKMKGYSFDNDGLSEAIIKKSQEAIELFMRVGVDFNKTDKEGYTAIDRAVMTKDRQTLAYVNNAFSNKYKHIIAEKETVNNDSETKSLLDFVMANDISGTKNFLENNTGEMNTLSEDGLAPIHYAIYNNNFEMTELLLENGADVNVRTSDGLTPLDVAILNEKELIVEKLRNYNAGMSYTLAKEMEAYSCNSVYNNDNDVYDADFEDIVKAAKLIKTQLEKSTEEES